MKTRRIFFWPSPRQHFQSEGWFLRTVGVGPSLRPNRGLPIWKIIQYLAPNKSRGSHDHSVWKRLRQIGKQYSDNFNVLFAPFSRAICGGLVEQHGSINWYEKVFMSFTLFRCDHDTFRIYLQLSPPIARVVLMVSSSCLRRVWSMLACAALQTLW